MCPIDRKVHKVPRESESKRVMCASRAVRVFVRNDAALMVERVEYLPSLTVANSLVFSARKQYRSEHQKTVTPELRSRKALYRLVREPTSGTRLNRPISVEPCAVKSKGVFRCIPPTVPVARRYTAFCRLPFFSSRVGSALPPSSLVKSKHQRFFYWQNRTRSLPILSSII